MKWKVVIGNTQILVDGENHRQATANACQLTGGGFDYLVKATPEDITTINAINKEKEKRP